MKTCVSGQPDIQIRPLSTFDAYESNVRSYCRSMPVTLSRAEGSEIWSENGRRYLDFLSGAGSINYGHNNPYLKSKLIDYITSNGITHSLDLHTRAKEQFLRALNTIILQPRQLDYVTQFTGPTGANAVEAALKLARKITGRHQVVHFTNSFHGVSLGALSVTGSKAMRKAAGVPLNNSLCLPYDGFISKNIDASLLLEKLVCNPSSGVETPAAVILEIVQGEGGLNVASVAWLERLAAACKRLGVLLIVDDIQAGCGRAGAFFSFEHTCLKPDIVVLSKSLAGYGLPLSIVLIKRDLDIWEPGEHNGTFRGNNHAFVTSKAMIEKYWRTRRFANEIKSKALQLKNRLKKIAEEFPESITCSKGVGLMQGISFRDPNIAAKVVASAFENGILIERCGGTDEVVKCMPPLTITSTQLDEGLDILEGSVRDTLATRMVTCNA